jgi:hypothetical protein
MVRIIVGPSLSAVKECDDLNLNRLPVTIRGAQTAFILFSTFLDLRPVRNSVIQVKNARLSGPIGLRGVFQLAKAV